MTAEGAGNGHAYSGNTMLASASLGNDSLLAHAPTKQDLSQRVVDFVSASVVQILSLKEDLTPPPILAAGCTTHGPSRPALLLFLYTVLLKMLHSCQ